MFSLKFQITAHHISRHGVVQWCRIRLRWRQPVRRRDTFALEQSGKLDVGGPNASRFAGRVSASKKVQDDYLLRLFDPRALILDNLGFNGIVEPRKRVVFKLATGDLDGRI
jgi:hypothetical protein